MLNKLSNANVVQPNGFIPLKQNYSCLAFSIFLVGLENVFMFNLLSFEGKKKILKKDRVCLKK